MVKFAHAAFGRGNPTGRYPDNSVTHTKTEFGFDVLEVAKHAQPIAFMENQEHTSLIDPVSLVV